MKKRLIAMCLFIFFIVVSITIYKSATKYKSINKTNFQKISFLKDLIKEPIMDDFHGILTNDDNLFSIVVQSSDNSFYMDHDYQKNLSSNGATFMDYRNNLESKKIIIYGHNSSVSDFKELVKYLDYYYVKEHPYMKLLIDNQIYNYKIFSIMLVPINYSKHTQTEFETASSLKEHINWMVNNSLFELGVDVGINNQFLLLQTCYDDSLLLINLKKESVSNV